MKCEIKDYLISVSSFHAEEVPNNKIQLVLETVVLFQKNYKPSDLEKSKVLH